MHATGRVTREMSENPLPYQGAGRLVDSGGTDGTWRETYAASHLLEHDYALEAQGRTSSGSRADVNGRLIARSNAGSNRTMFDEWPVWPRRYFNSEAWLRLAFDAAFESKDQTRRHRKTLMDHMKAVRNGLSRVDFDHPVMQPVLWVGGVAIPLLILIAVFV